MGVKAINKLVILSLFFLFLNVFLVSSFDVNCGYNECTIKKLRTYYDLNLDEGRVQIEARLNIHDLKKNETNIAFYLIPFGFQDELRNFTAKYFEGHGASLNYEKGFSVKDNSKNATVKKIAGRKQYNPHGEIYTSYDYSINISVKNDSVYVLIIDFMTPNLLTHIGTEYLLKYEIHNADDVPDHELFVIFPKDITVPETTSDYSSEGKPPLTREVYVIKNENPVFIVFQSIKELEAYQNKLEWKGAIKGGIIGFILSLLASILFYFIMEGIKPSIDKEYFDSKILELINTVKAIGGKIKKAKSTDREAKSPITRFKKRKKK
ncbi:hypothetical protein KY366_05810 [Candidatus Woesearchaeota archaeon]|nr:hypothetical protein [Candidatus Woesearchaeota archaeon]